VEVNVLRRVDFPTEGKPMSATRASPRRATSNPSPEEDPPPPPCSMRSSERKRASFALSVPRW